MPIETVEHLMAVEPAEELVFTPVFGVKHRARTLKVAVYAGRFEETRWMDGLEELKPGRYEVPLSADWNVKVLIEVPPETAASTDMSVVGGDGQVYTLSRREAV